MEAREGAPERYSRRVLRTLAAFGLTVDDVRIDREQRKAMGEGARRLAERTLAALPAGRIAVITGPSGAGKSTVLRAIGEVVCRRGQRAVEARRERAIDRSRRRSIDLAASALAGGCGRPASDEAAMRLLASAGLADARLAVMAACELSEGERARLLLAIAMGTCCGSTDVVLLVDEFGASLDDVTARAVARGVSRWVARQGARAVLVVHDAALARALRPRVLVRLRPGWIHACAGRSAA